MEITVPVVVHLTAAPQKRRKIVALFLILGAVISLSAVVLIPRHGNRTATTPEALAIAPSQQPPATSPPLATPSVVGKATRTQSPKIEGLFGVNLGEPFPSNKCTVSSASETIGGFYAIIFTPPEANDSFDTYVVYLDATRRVVATIDATTKNLDFVEFERVRDAVIAKFREHYGKEALSGGDKMWTYTWTIGKRNVTVTEIMDQSTLSVSCTDQDLYDSVAKSRPAVDTRGL